MIITYTMIALWGVVNVLQAYKIFRSIIVYEINRRRDKKLYAKNIYITRSDRSEIIVLAVALPMTPCSDAYGASAERYRIPISI